MSFNAIYKHQFYVNTPDALRLSKAINFTPLPLKNHSYLKDSIGSILEARLAG